MMADRPMSRRERLSLSILGLLMGVLFICAPKLIAWWLVFASAQLNALAGLLGWR